MQLLTLLGLAASIASSVAAPVAEAEAAAKNFYVQASVIKGNQEFDGMYVEGYHTGAGTNDATLSKKAAFTAKLDNGHLIFNFGGGKGIIYGTEFDLETQYTSFQPVTINSIDGTVSNLGPYCSPMS